MRYLAPYQSGMWLAEYLNRRCQLCGVCRSEPLSQCANAQRTHFLAKIESRINQGLLCSSCHHDIHWQPPPFQVDIAAGTALSIQAATDYDYPIRQAIRAFKHHEDMTQLPLLVHIIRQLPKPQGCHHDNSVLVPMPTTNSRLIKRGFDPVTILSVYLSKHWQIPLWHGVERIDNTVSQQGLSRAERLTNLQGAFKMTQLPPVKHLLLFDDVATTGASLQALARALLLHNTPNTQCAAYALAHVKGT